MSVKSERNLRIVDYLLIKLVNIVAGLPLGLNVDGVILDTFSGRHVQAAEKNEDIVSVIFIRRKSQEETNRTRTRSVGMWGGRRKGASDGWVKKKICVVVGVYKGKRGALKRGAMTTHCMHVEIT